MTGPLILVGNPQAELEAAPKQYVDAETERAEEVESEKLNLTGGTMSGPLILSRNPQGQLEGSTKQYVDAETTRAETQEGNLENSIVSTNVSLSSKVNKAGDVMVGPLTLAGNPTQNLQAAPKQYVDAETERAENVEAGLLPSSGGTMTGALILSENPTQSLQAATKEYVDNAIQNLLS